MTSVLDVPAIMYDRINGKDHVGTFSSCLDEWSALPTKDQRALSVIAVNGEKADWLPNLIWTLDADQIERALEKRATGELT